MEKGTSAGKLFRCVGSALIIAFMLAGCQSTKILNAIKMKSETEIAVSSIKLEWLKKCDGLEGPMPENQIGALLQDNALLSAALAVCIARHNSFVEYMKPIVEKERGATPATP